MLLSAEGTKDAPTADPDAIERILKARGEVWIDNRSSQMRLITNDFFGRCVMNPIPRVKRQPRWLMGYVAVGAP